MVPTGPYKATKVSYRPLFCVHIVVFGV